jgi:sugar lactone lactonase YvrE
MQVVLEGLGIPESLRWHDDTLWFSDLARGTVHRWTGTGTPETVAAIPGRAGGIGWLPDGRLLAVSMDQRCVYRQEHDGSLNIHAELGPLAMGEANDMTVDDLGRSYVGNFGFDYHQRVRQAASSMLYAPPGPPKAALACFDPDGHLLGASEALLFPNGSVVTDDGQTLVVAESLAMRLSAFAIHPDGSLGERRVWASFIAPALWKALNNPRWVGRVVRQVSAILDRPSIARHSSSPIAPDGIALAQEGTIWVANALRGECVRVEAGGRIVERIRTGRPTLSCVLGGAGGRTLYAATASTSDPADARDGGRIESVLLPPG